MQQQLLQALAGKWLNKPILVMGGGPSVSEDLPRLTITPACVISANDHGSKQDRFPVDLYVNCDKQHIFKKVPMESILRPIVEAKGGAIVNKFSWADFRLADWSFEGNSGLAAVVVAAALGGNPIIVTGLDFWHGGRLYFHGGDGRKPTAKRRTQAMALSLVEKRKKIHPLLAAIRGANLRPMSGPLTLAFPTYDPAEVVPSYSPTPYREKMLKLRSIPVEATRRFSMSANDSVRVGKLMTLSEGEYRKVMDRVKVAKSIQPAL